MSGQPLGFAAASADWNEAFAGRPMEYHDWLTLTFGEQQRYAAQECKTKGAVYSSRVSRNSIAFEISLPESLALDGLTEDEAGSLERHLHRVLEKQISSILTLRAYKRESEP